MYRTSVFYQLYFIIQMGKLTLKTLRRCDFYNYHIINKNRMVFVYYLTLSIIGENFSNERDAPPTSAPSMSSIDISSFEFDPFTEPPY